jgi:hypothetical protein
MQRGVLHKSIGRRDRSALGSAVSLPGLWSRGRVAQMMFAVAREQHGNIVYESSRSALPVSTERQFVSRMASAVQRDWCVPRVSIGAVFACCAGVEVRHVLSVGLRGQPRPLVAALPPTP